MGNNTSFAEAQEKAEESGSIPQDNADAKIIGDTSTESTVSVPVKSLEAMDSIQALH